MHLKERADGWFVASIAEAEALGPGPCILTPVTAALEPHLATMACALPTGDANGSLLRALAGGTPPDRTVGAVLAHDPFQRTQDLLDQLRAAGIAGLTNWPTVGPLDGELAAALEHSGFTYAREIELLRAARDHGFGIMPVVHTAEQLRQALTLEPGQLLVTPGLSAASAEDRRRRALTATELAEQALQEPALAVWMHLHPGFGSLLQELLPEGVGVVRHCRNGYSSL